MLRRASSDHKNRNNQQMSKHPKATRQRDPLKEQKNIFCCESAAKELRTCRRCSGIVESKVYYNSKWSEVKSNKKKELLSVLLTTAN